jgi:hypothetical protein
MLFISVLAIDPLAPWSVKAFLRTVEMILKLPFLALNDPKLGWFFVSLPWVLSLVWVCGLG